MSDDRDERGRFVAGNAGGPGRPRRAIEREYLAIISEAVTLEDWRAIVAHAVEVAKQGDEKARAWLAKYVLGDTPITLTELAARELLDVSPDREIAAHGDEITDTRPHWAFDDQPPTLIQRAVDTLKAEQQAAIEQQAAEERARKRAERKAKQAAENTAD